MTGSSDYLSLAKLRVSKFLMNPMIIQSKARHELTIGVSLSISPKNPKSMLWPMTSASIPPSRLYGLPTPSHNGSRRYGLWRPSGWPTSCWIVSGMIVGRSSLFEASRAPVSILTCLQYGKNHPSRLQTPSPKDLERRGVCVLSVDTKYRHQRYWHWDERNIQYHSNLSVAENFKGLIAICEKSTLRAPYTSTSTPQTSLLAEILEACYRRVWYLQVSGSAQVAAVRSENLLLCKRDSLRSIHLCCDRQKQWQVF